MKLTWRKAAVVVAVLAVLAAAFWYGGGAPGLEGWAVGGAQTGGRQAGPTPPRPAALTAEKEDPQGVTAPPDGTPEPTDEAPAETPTEAAPAETPAETAAPAPTKGLGVMEKKIFLGGGGGVFS